jgi:demethylphylloquinol methyltransferase
MTSPTSPEIQALFNRIAPVYDRLNDRLSFGMHRVWKWMAVKWSGAKPGDLCLDLCCGTGDVSLLLAQVVGTQGQVVGVDFAAALLAEAALRSQRYRPVPPIEWVQGDALHLDFADNSFDAATLSYGLRNVTDIPRCLGELHRVLKPGARAAILDMHNPQNPTLRRFQQWFLEQQVVPAADRLGVLEDYAYINPSIERFPQGPRQEQLARSAGFHAIHHPIAGGMMGILVVTKPFADRPLASRTLAH